VKKHSGILKNFLEREKLHTTFEYKSKLQVKTDLKPKLEWGKNPEN
jgi:hypothetical protein